MAMLFVRKSLTYLSAYFFYPTENIIQPIEMDTQRLAGSYLTL